MKLTADTPPGGDFVRYLAEIEQSSPSYQTLNASLIDANAAPVPRGRLRTGAKEAERPVSAPDDTAASSARRRPATGRDERPTMPRVSQALQDLAQLPPPPLRAVVAPLLQRLERALAEAARRQ